MPWGGPATKKLVSGKPVPEYETMFRGSRVGFLPDRECR